MRAESVKLGQALLNHHLAKTSAFPPGKRLTVSKYTIAYGDLCAAAGVPHLIKVVGNFLQDIAEWSSNNGHPPLNALAVNGTSGIPGEGYDGAGGFKAINWAVDVEKCIRCTGYPKTFP